MSIFLVILSLINKLFKKICVIINLSLNNLSDSIISMAKHKNWHGAARKRALKKKLKSLKKKLLARISS
ncbi:MAG: hypothetical protein WAS94_03950 [Candidatus Saccharimonadales bacterium]